MGRPVNPIAGPPRGVYGTEGPSATRKAWTMVLTTASRAVDTAIVRNSSTTYRPVPGDCDRQGTENVRFLTFLRTATRQTGP